MDGNLRKNILESHILYKSKVVCNDFGRTSERRTNQDYGSSKSMFSRIAKYWITLWSLEID